MPKGSWFRRYMASASTVLMMAPTVAIAQSNSSPDAGAPGEIIVTAQKRSETASKIGVTIAAFGGDTLRSQGVNSVADLSRLVPSLVVAPSQANTPVYTLRGVGFYDNTLGSYPAVSVYLDEAPLSLPVFTSQVGFDLERVEVLKGPQGTLYGQNSTGGAINYIAAKPTETFKAGADLSYGRFNDFNGSAFISGPLTDTLTARIAVKGESADGWQESYTRSDRNGKIRTFAGRGLLNWKPSPDLSFLLTVSGDKDHSDPQATQYIELATQAGPPTPALAAAQFAPARPRAADWSADMPPRGDDRQYNVSLRSEWNLAENVKLTSLTTYTHFNRDQTVDPDGLPLQEYGYTTHAGAKSFNQEVRLSNRDAGRIQWTLGGNYERTTFFEDNLLYFKDNTTRAYVGQWETNGFNTDQSMRNYAFFGDTQVKILSGLKLKGGLRYTHNSRIATDCTSDTDRGYLAAYFTNLSTSLRAAEGLPAIPTIAPGSCVNLDNVTRDAQGLLSYLPGAFHGTLNEHNVSWHAGLDYQATPSTLLYLNIAKGYKAGGYTAGANATDLQFLPVTQESLLDYEAGFKTALFNRKVSMTGAVFYYDYRDKQLRTKDLDPVFGLLDAIRNIPKSRMYGAEISVNASPFHGLNIYSSATYLNSRIQKFTGYDSTDQLISFAGDPIPFAPKWSVTGGGDYTQRLNEGMSAFVGGNVNYNSKTYSTVGTDDYSKIKAYETVDARVGLQTQGGRWRMTLWGKNIFNKYYWTNAIIVNDVRVRYAGRPATYGVSLGFRM